MSKKILLSVNEEQLEKIEFLKPLFKTKARTKVLIASLNKTYEFYVNLQKK